MKLDLKTSAFLFVALFCSHVSAQIFWTETFDSSPCVAGSGCSPSIVSWTVTTLAGNGSTPNEWYVSDTESGLAPPSCGAAVTLLTVCNFLN